MATSPFSTSPTGKKLVQTKSGLRMISIIDGEKSAFDINESEWQEDSKHLICNKCGSKFSFKTRRHHCRRCGKIFCGSCCDVKLELPRLGFVDPQRVCTDCVIIAKNEQELFEKYIPLLVKGASFEINESAEDVVRCKLNSRTHRDLLFSNPKDMNEIPYQPVPLQDIISFQCLTDPLRQTQQGTGQLVGVNMKHLTDGECRELKLSVTSTIENRKESLSFLITLQKFLVVTCYKLSCKPESTV